MKKNLAMITAMSLMVVSTPAFAKEAQFSDVPSGAWYEEAVYQVASEGLIIGNDGKFNPNATMTTIEFITIMVRMIDQSIDLSMKLGDTHWAEPVYRAGLELSLFTEEELIYSDIDAIMNRELMATIAVRVLTLKDEILTTITRTSNLLDFDQTTEEYKSFVAKAYTFGIVKGTSANEDGTSNFNPKGTVTRAEAATIVRNMSFPEYRNEVETLMILDENQQEYYDEFLNMPYLAIYVDVIELVNIERAAVGLQPLTLNYKMCLAADYKSNEMLELKYFSHTSPIYGSPFNMMSAFDITYRTAAENIAQGQTTAKMVMNSWMNSPGHCANILNPSFNQIGIGLSDYGCYWTQMFTD